MKSANMLTFFKRLFLLFTDEKSELIWHFHFNDLRIIFSHKAFMNAMICISLIIIAIKY